MRVPTILVSFSVLVFLVSVGTAVSVSGAAHSAVTSVPGGYQVDYPVRLANGTSNGGDIVGVVILEWDDGGRIHADLPFTVAGRGATTLSHVVGFPPTSALVLGYGLGISGVGDEKDHVFSLTNPSFAAAVTGRKWSEAFPGVTPDTRVGHNALIGLLQQAAAGDQAALDALVEFVRTEGVRAAFDPADRFRVVEWTIGTPIDPMDLGDAPDSYATLFASNGPSHLLTALYLGACVDAENEGQPSVGADGDDTGPGTSSVGACAGNDDEDGVIFGSLSQCAPGTATVTASQAGLLDAWIDFDGDGDFLDAGEQIATSLALGAGANPVGFAVPCAAVTTITYSRFRVSTAGGAGPQGAALDGEVEDHALTIGVAMPDLSATKTSSFDPLAHDNDGNGVLSPGDALAYSVQIVNAGGADATGVVLTDSPDPNTTLVVGSVTTDQGTVTTGNTAGDLSVAVDVGTLAAGGDSVTVSFLVTVNDPLPPEISVIANQAVVSGSNFVQLVSDDPTDPAVDDPTDDAILGAELLAIPSLSTLGLLLFSVALSLVALRAAGR